MKNREKMNFNEQMKLRKRSNDSLRRIPLEGFALDLNGAIDPLLLIFSKEPVAAHNIPLQKAITPNGEKHIASTCRPKMAARAIHLSQDILMKEKLF